MFMPLRSSLITTAGSRKQLGRSSYTDASLLTIFLASCRCMPFLNPLALPQVSSTPEYKESWCSQSVSHRSWYNGVVPLPRVTAQIDHRGFFHVAFYNHNHDPQLLINVSIRAYDDEDPLTFALRTSGIWGVVYQYGRHTSGKE